MKNKEDLIKQAAALAPIPHGTMEFIKQCEGFKTGSSVYGPTDEAKDVDWVVNRPAFLFDENTVCATTDQEYIDDRMTVLYGNYEGDLINILCIGDSGLFESWRTSTEMMKTLPIFEVKWQRVRVFRAFLDVFWSVQPVPQMISLKDAHRLQKCIICNREAVYFSTAHIKKHYENTGICERCSTT